MTNVGSKVCPVCRGKGTISLDRGYKYIARTEAIMRCLYCDGSGKLSNQMDKTKGEEMKKDKFDKLSPEAQKAHKARQREYDRQYHQRRKLAKEASKLATEATQKSEPSHVNTTGKGCCAYCGSLLESYIEEGEAVAKCPTCQIKISQSVITMRLLPSNYTILVEQTLLRCEGLLSGHGKLELDVKGGAD